MIIKSGIPSFSKSDRKAIKTLIDHAEHDISYGSSGTYNKGEDKLDTVSIRQAKRAIELIEYLLKVS